jgi:predicted nucleic acid-binding protein
VGARRVSAAYIDTSALVKLFKPERETAAFREALGAWPVQVASELIQVEAICTARRIGGSDILERARAAIERITMITLSRPIIELAAGPATPELRAMDAIHLATSPTPKRHMVTSHVAPAFGLDSRRARR